MFDHLRSVLSLYHKLI